MKELNYTVLETNRLRLRKPTQDDEMIHFRYQSDANNFPNVDMLVYKDIQQVKDYFNNMVCGTNNKKWLFWIIADKHSNTALGTISLWNVDKDLGVGELGFGLYKEARGFGFMSEAVRAVLDYSFIKLDMNRVFAYTDEKNRESIKVLNRLGFDYDKKAREEAHCHDGFMNYNVYSISN